MLHNPHRRSRYTPPRRWQPLTDAEWDALLPYVLVRTGPGRPLKDARKRMDAVFWIAASWISRCEPNSGFEHRCYVAAKLAFPGKRGYIGKCRFQAFSMEDPISVPAGEVQRRFALWQDRALTQPVAITSRGRPRVVMISADEFERLRRRDRQALRVEDLPGELVDAIAATEPPEEARRFDGEVG